MTNENAITPEMVAGFAASFGARPERRTLMNAVTRTGVNNVAFNRDAWAALPYTFSDELETGKVTNQKHSGRCWLFAGLNTLRYAVAQKYNLADFELSAGYLMFWDKLEKANYFLENILETRDEETDGRLVVWLLAAPLADAGQWGMFADLVAKYGVVPKAYMPETAQTEDSQIMNRLLASKAREDAAALRAAARAGENLEALRGRKRGMLDEYYRMLAIFLGEPPRRFDFEYRDKDRRFLRAPALTPLDFLTTYVPVDVRDFVGVTNAPMANKPFGRPYRVRFLGNVAGGVGVTYLNVDAATLKRLAVAQLKEGEPVWFGCDVRPMNDRASGLMAAGLYDYRGALDTPLGMAKGERLDYRDSCLTHAMAFTGVNLVGDAANRWKVENSWGEEAGQKGFFVMDDGWFDEYVYEVVVRRKYLDAELAAALEQPPIVLPPWDPMGSLAG
jgi:bleomycin hydrolase